MRETEKRRRHAHGGHARGDTVLVHASVRHFEERLLFEDIGLAYAVDVVGRAGAVAGIDAGLGITIARDHDAIRRRDRERPQQHVIDDGEEGCVRAETHGQRGAHSQRERSLLPEQAQRQLDVAPDRVEPNRAHVADRFSRLRDAAEVEPRDPLRLRQ